MELDLDEGSRTEKCPSSSPIPFHFAVSCRLPSIDSLQPTGKRPKERIRKLTFMLEHSFQELVPGLQHGKVNCPSFWSL